MSETRGICANVVYGVRAHTHTHELEHEHVSSTGISGHLNMYTLGMWARAVLLCSLWHFTKTTRYSAVLHFEFKFWWRPPPPFLLAQNAEMCVMYSHWWNCVEPNVAAKWCGRPSSTICHRRPYSAERDLPKCCLGFIFRQHENSILKRPPQTVKSVQRNHYRLLVFAEWCECAYICFICSFNGIKQRTRSLSNSKLRACKDTMELQAKTFEALSLFGEPKNTRKRQI